MFSVGLARQDGQCIGGHLDEGCIVKTTAELILCELSDFEFRRTIDKDTGFRELTVHKRDNSTPDGAIRRRKR